VKYAHAAGARLILQVNKVKSRSPRPLRAGALTHRSMLRSTLRIAAHPTMPRTCVVSCGLIRYDTAVIADGGWRASITPIHIATIMTLFVRHCSQEPVKESQQS
jgi:hypothetical protein